MDLGPDGKTVEDSFDSFYQLHSATNLHDLIDLDLDVSLYLRNSLLTESGYKLNIATPSSTSDAPELSAMNIKDLPTDKSGEVDCKALMELLKKCSSLQEQVEIIHLIYVTKGIDWNIEHDEYPEMTVYDVLMELYTKAGNEQNWGLIRYISGMLHKKVEELDEACTTLLSNQKHLTVGLPPEPRERTITAPLPYDELTKLIEEASDNDHSLFILTQEVMVYLAMYARTEPNLFAEMFRLRIGLIIQVMATEMANCLKYSDKAGTQSLMSVKPSDLKTLLHHILSGKEFSIEENIDQSTRTMISIHDVDHTGATKSERAGISKLKVEMMQTGTFKLNDSDELHEALRQSLISSELISSEELDVGDFVDVRHGQWLRRRRIDGALNRVPIGFYQRVWKMLQKCKGLSIENYVLHSSTTEEMTPGEIKFAVQVETFLNCVPQPEYRQLLVETILVLTMLVDIDLQYISRTIHIERIAQMANSIFMAEQTALGADDEMLEKDPATGICSLLYDSAPSGRFGTMTYLLKATAIYIEDFLPADGCQVQ